MNNCKGPENLKSFCFLFDLRCLWTFFSFRVPFTPSIIREREIKLEII